MAQAAGRGRDRTVTRNGMSLLAEEWAGEMLRMLDEAPFTAEEVDQRLRGDIELSPRRGLRKLGQAGLLVSLPGDGSPRRSRYALGPPGRDLLDAIAALEAWRGRWTPKHATDAGLRRLVARREARLVGRALVEGPLPFRDLQRRVPGLSAGTLHRVLNGLREPGIVCLDARSTRSHPLYELGEPAQRLGRFIVLSGRWRWRWAADHAPVDAGDLPALVHLLAPLTKVPKQLDGVCQLAVQPLAHWPEDEPLAVWVQVAGGHLSALTLQPVLDIRAHMSASPLAWCEALLHGAKDGIEIAGDATLAEAVVVSLAQAVSR